MKKHRYDKCKELINKGVWSIDLDKGIVIGKNGSTGSLTKYGYLVLTCEGYQFKVHEIIAVAGGLNPTGLTVDHINNIRTDNRLCNLQLLTNSENASKGWKGHRDRTLGSRNGQSKLTEQGVIDIKILLADGKLSQRCIAWLFGVSPMTISDINTGKCWSQVVIKC